jgi:hypothetical protein
MAAEYSKEELAALRKACPGVMSAEEAGAALFMLPQLTLPFGCSPAKVDALLCPTARDGYPSRLYFAQQITSPNARNWNGNWYVLERHWYAFSWSVKATDLTLVQTLLEHLEGLK